MYISSKIYVTKILRLRRVHICVSYCSLICLKRMPSLQLLCNVVWEYCVSEIMTWKETWYNFEKCLAASIAILYPRLLLDHIPTLGFTLRVFLVWFWKTMNESFVMTKIWYPYLTKIEVPYSVTLGNRQHFISPNCLQGSRCWCRSF